MKLVDTDADRPDDETEPAPHVTPPRPEKRRAAASLILTLTILIGTVVTIYSVFPPRRSDIVGIAIRAHRKAEPAWQLVAPTPGELRAWTVALLGAGAPLPDAPIVGARAVELRDHRGALVRYKVGDDEVSYLVERGADAPAQRGTRAAGAELADAWRDGPWTCVMVGPSAGAAAWRAALGVP